MTRNEALEWVHGHTDDEQLDSDELREAFTTLIGRTPATDEDTFEQWSLVCQEAGY